jgi:arginine exporter protein ArgO
VGAFLEGVVAGLGIAVPVGPIAVLLVDLSMRRGFSHALPAAVGVASADLTYATVAAALGSAAASALRPFERPLHIVGAAVVAAIAAGRIWRLWRSKRSSAPARDAAAGGRERAHGAATYLAFLGLTLLNPATVVYFAALILGLQADALGGAAGKGLFVAGACAASASWQVALVTAGGVLHRRLPSGAGIVTGLAGSAVLLALAVRLLLL